MRGQGRGMSVECGVWRGESPLRESPFRNPESGEAAPYRREAAPHPCSPTRSGASSFTLFSAAKPRNQAIRL